MPTYRHRTPQMGNAASGLPYVLGDAVPSYTERQGWTMFKATKKGDKSECTIFKFDARVAAGSRGASKAAAQNNLKCSKVYKHPNIVKCLDGTESPAGDILVVTEPVVPLLDWLTQTRAAEPSKESFAEAVNMGLAGIVRAISFLSNDVGVVHGLLSPDSVFVTRGGDWKLSRFDLSGKIDASFLDRQSMLSQPYSCPARAASDRAAMRNMPIHAIDAWSLGVLIHTIYCGETSRIEDLQHASKIPRGLRQAYQRLLKSKPEQRLNPSSLCKLKHFSTPLVQSMMFLEEIMIKTPEEKHVFFQSLTSRIDSFPAHVCKYKLLPALTASLSLGATSGETSMGVAGPVVLVPLLKLGRMLDEDEYSQHIVPVLLTMFEQQDRGIRVALLSQLDALVETIDRKLINDKIFTCICTGFNDTAPAMREMTLKSLPTLVPKLDANVIEGQMKKVLVRMLQDPVPAIRTNATVCLGLLAHHFKPETVAAVCIPGFTRALRDTFPHNRERALHSIKAVVGLFDPTDLATKVMPHVCPSLVDSVSSVRSTGQDCIRALAQRLEAHSEDMAALDAAKKQEMSELTAMGSTPTKKSENGGASVVGWMASAAVSSVTSATTATSKVFRGSDAKGYSNGDIGRKSRGNGVARDSGSGNGSSRSRGASSSRLSRESEHLKPNNVKQNRIAISHSKKQQKNKPSSSGLKSKIKSSSSSALKEGGTIDDFFDGWGSDPDEDDLGLRMDTQNSNMRKGGSSILKPNKIPARKTNESIASLTSATTIREKDLMDDSWGQDDQDLDELLDFSSPEQSPKSSKSVQKKSAVNKGLKVKAEKKRQKKKKNELSSQLKKGLATSGMSTGSSNKSLSSQSNLFEEFGF